MAFLIQIFTCFQTLYCGNLTNSCHSFFQSEFLCPICNKHGKVFSLKPNGWKDGRLRRLMPRQIYGLSGRVLLISRVYSCSVGQEINGHDHEQKSGRIPFLLSHKTGVTRELLEMFVSMVCNGLSFSQIYGRFARAATQASLVT